MSQRHIFIRELCCEAEIGVYAHEKAQRQKIIINIDVTMQDRPHHDQLTNTICYDALSKVVLQAVAAARCDLLETLAERIAQACLEASPAEHVRITITKPNALPNISAAGIEITRSRSSS